MVALIPAAPAAVKAPVGPTLPPPRLDRPAREVVRASVLGAWARTDMLFCSVDSDAAFQTQPDPLRNPLVFYLGHPAAFYVNKLVMAGLLATGGVEPALEALFERGVDPAHADDLALTAYPRTEAVWRYRDRVRAVVLGVIDRVSWDGEIGPDDPRWALLMALEHERIHFETSSVLLRQLPVEAVRRPPGWRYAAWDAPAPADAGALVAVGGGRVTLGRPAWARTFGWDNEHGRLDVEVAPFEAGRDLVTNGELLAFVRAGGYAHDALWSAEGRAWRDARGVTAPRFWVPRATGYAYRAMFDELPLPLAWPAEVTAHEAEAYARWASASRGVPGMRLPTEAEHAQLAAGAPLDEHGDVVASEAYNLCLRLGSPSPVGSFGGATSRWGCRDVRGNVWQWLADDFAPLPGFATHPYYPDFSTPYFGSDHGMMAGGSWASTGGSASRWYRLWFRRFFHQHAGFRLVRSVGA
ncbi:MAG: 5-histidylcysteine sulfoxide synthase [Deltaproteobacteria bacterium]|nr:5-histidylcysteine sulfoxide synthase [Deltaproteobacteria bacterium]